MTETLQLKTNPADYFDIPGFDVQASDNTHVTGREGSIEIAGENEEGSFSLTYTPGYSPPSAVRGVYKEFEEDVIYVDDMDVQTKIRGRGIGYKLREGLVGLARSEGASAIRSYTKSPAIIKILDRLFDEGVITEPPKYHVYQDDDWVEQPTTAEFLDGRELSSTSEQALAALNDPELSVVTVIKL